MVNGFVTSLPRHTVSFENALINLEILVELVELSIWEVLAHCILLLGIKKYDMLFSKQGQWWLTSYSYQLLRGG